MDDPFASTPGASPSDFALTTARGRKPRQKPCDWTGEPKKKRADFNEPQRRWFERNGYTFARTEHRNAFSGKSHDLWTFGDWLAVKPGEVLIVQTCAKSSISARLKKARETKELWIWLAALPGTRFVVHGWTPPAGRGGRWELTEREVVAPKGDDDADEKN